MNGINPKTDQRKPPSVATLAATGVILQWLSQPPLAAWPIALVSLVPWLMLVTRTDCIGRRGETIIWLAGFLYWLLTLQGLRHAHPAIYVGWFALAAYLSVYAVLFVALARRWLRKGVPLWVTAPTIWIGLECVRNYFATGISAAMLGHTMADVPIMIQIADLFGSYGVGFVIVSVNVAIYQGIARWLPGTTTVRPRQERFAAIALAATLLVATLAYGMHRLNQPTSDQDLATFALVQRSEQVEYVQNLDHESKMFYNYARQAMAAVEGTTKRVDAIVWPESMFSGGMFWIDDPTNAVPPPQFGVDAQEFRRGIDYQRNEFLLRAADMQNAFAASNSEGQKPHLIGGVGVVRYSESPEMFSAIVDVDPAGSVAAWYGKTHRMMFGEYIPVLSSIRFLRDYIPLGLRLSKGPGPQRFHVGDTTVSPNICIETAVERVTVQQLSQLKRDGELPDVVLTVTNDGWFDDSSVIEHHLRCAQLVAVGCRRPILSAANNGPTAWIDSNGQVVQRLPTGSEGAIIATPKEDERVSLYVRIGDWPARILAILCVGTIAMMGYEKYRTRRAATNQ